MPIETTIHPEYGYLVKMDGQVHQVSKEQYEAAQAAPTDMTYALGQGADQAFDQLAGGMADAYLRLRGDDDVAAHVQPQLDQEQALAGQFNQFPISTAVGSAAPYVAGGAIAAPFGGAGLIGQGVAQGVSAAVVGGVSQTGDAGDRIGTAMEEGALGLAGAFGGGVAERAINRMRGRFAHSAAGQFQGRGGQLSPGQVSGNKIVQRVEASIDSAGGFDSARAANNQLMQSKAGRALGLDESIEGGYDLSEAGLGEAADQISDRFTQALSGDATIPIDDATKSMIERAGASSDFIEMPQMGDVIDSKTYQQVRSKLGAISRAEATSGSKTPGKLEAVNDLIDQLDNAFMDSAGADSAKLLRTAREQWKVLKALEKGQSISPDGIINPRSLKSSLNRSFGTTARRARTGPGSRLLPETSELLDISSDAASKFAQQIVGDSGTATRAGLPIVSNALAGGAGGMGAYALAIQSGATHEQALAAAALGTVGGVTGLNQYGRLGLGRGGRLGPAAGGTAAAGLMGSEDEPGLMP